MCPQGRTNKRIALDGKPGARTLILPSVVWAAEPRTVDSRGEQLTSRVTKPRVSACIYIILHKCLDLNTVRNRTYKTNRQNSTINQTNSSLHHNVMNVNLFYKSEIFLAVANQHKPLKHINTQKINYRRRQPPHLQTHTSSRHVPTLTIVGQTAVMQEGGTQDLRPKQLPTKNLSQQ
jgi:hypothetical protein